MFKKALLLLVFVFLFDKLYSFPPRNFGIFSNNVIRLLKNRQYFYLEKYYEKHHYRFLKISNYHYLSAKLIEDIPILNTKKSFIEIYLKKNKKPFSRICFLKAWVLYDQHEVKQAYQWFKKVTSPLGFFYMGLIDFDLKRDKEADRYLKKFLAKVNKNKFKKEVSKAYLVLSEINYRQKNYTLSLKYAEKSNLRSIDRTILLYFVYKKLGRLQKSKNILEFIKNNYSKTLKGKNFFDSSPLK